MSRKLRLVVFLLVFCGALDIALSLVMIENTVRWVLLGSGAATLGIAVILFLRGLGRESD